MAEQKQTGGMLPEHIGIIMDGNGRWAQKRGLPRSAGHKQGARTFREIVRYCRTIGIRYLTVYAFSTENWARPEDEVKFIMHLPVEFYDRFVPELHRNNVKIQMIGDTKKLPKETLEALERAEAMTHLNTGLILNFALNYGGRAEITQAVKQIAQEVLDAKFSPEDITEEMIADSLYTESLPRVLRDPDLIIRTSGEIRLSNFLPWQAAYSELYFTDVMWPDFGEEALRSAIVEYSHRHRRFGGV